MVSSSVTALFALAAVLTLLFPAALLIVLGARKKIGLLPLGLGFLSFLVSQVLTRIPLLQFFSAQPWYQQFAADSPYLLGILLAFTAGLFEESARLGGAALLGPRKPDYPGGPPRPGWRSWQGALSFGLGHAFCEVVLLVGLTHVNNLVVCLLMNTGGTELLTMLLPAGQVDQVVAQMAAVQPLDIVAGLLERVSAVLFHLFATSLVFCAAAQRKWLLYPAAVLAHTLFNAAALLPIGLWGIELVLLGLGLVCGVLFWKSKKWFKQ